MAGTNYITTKNTGGNYRHGMTGTPTYGSWSTMRNRCSEKNLEKRKWYLDKGITVCERWQNSFEAFLEDMGVRPDNTSIDRIDNSDGYSPENCRWATPTEQSRNRCSNYLIEHNGETLCLTEWAERTGLKRETIKARIDDGLDVETALTKELKPMPVYEYLGEYMGIRKLARITGTKYSTIEDRIKKGMSVEEAITKPVSKHIFREITYKGDTKNIAEWVRSTGISRHIIVSRLNQGWTPEAILTTPVRGKQHVPRPVI